MPFLDAQPLHGWKLMCARPRQAEEDFSTNSRFQEFALRISDL